MVSCWWVSKELFDNRETKTRQGTTNMPVWQSTILEMKKIQSQIAQNFEQSRGVPSGYYLIIKDVLNCWHKSSILAIAVPVKSDQPPARATRVDLATGHLTGVLGWTSQTAVAECDWEYDIGVSLKSGHVFDSSQCMSHLKPNVLPVTWYWAVSDMALIQYYLCIDLSFPHIALAFNGFQFYRFFSSLDLLVQFGGQLH